jgi:hypothetical protein
VAPPTQLFPLANWSLQRCWTVLCHSEIPWSSRERVYCTESLRLATRSVSAERLGTTKTTWISGCVIRWKIVRQSRPWPILRTMDTLPHNTNSFSRTSAWLTMSSDSAILCHQMLLLGSLLARSGSAEEPAPGAEARDSDQHLTVNGLDEGYTEFDSQWLWSRYEEPARKSNKRFFRHGSSNFLSIYLT